VDINRISVSRKQVWDQCTQLYKYRYHLKLDSPEEEPFYFVFGKIVHKVAEEYIRGQGETPIQEITKDVLAGKIALEEHDGNIAYAPKKIPKEYNKRFPGVLKSIYDLTEKIGFSGDLEWNFNFDLDPPNEKLVTGFIDRLLIKDGFYYIIDYKTTKKGRYQKESNELVSDLQLRVYSRIVQKEYDVCASKIKAALYYLEGGKLSSAQFSNKSLLAAEEELLKTYDRIVETKPEDAWGTVGQHCNRCDYRSICPFLRNKNYKPELPASLR